MELKDVFVFVIACLLSYLLGGVSIARLMTKKESAGGINNQGSGNPGTMNMLRTHGIGMGLFTLFCDALKGVIPALFGLLYFKEMTSDNMAYIALYTFGLFAVVGHVFPMYYKFKGGKGIATTFGIFMVADPIASVILFGIMFITLYFIKIGSVVSLLFITIDAVVQLFRSKMNGNYMALIIMILIVVLDIWCHRQNIGRLIENKENPADLQEGLKKDIEKIKNKREKKLEKHNVKSERIEQKYNEKIENKEKKAQAKMDKFNSQK